MMFVTGDCHGDYRRFNVKNFPQQKEMTKDDYVIVCGDFGYWLPSKAREHDMDELEQRSFTTLFVDGNHEDYDSLNSLPVEEWNGGKVHKIRKSVIHLMRGQYYMIGGKTVFTFGGAASHDVQGGIFDVLDIERCRKKETITAKNIVPEELMYYYYDEANYVPYRVNHVSWWKEEVPTEEEFLEGVENLKAHGNKVDFVFSHDGPSSDVAIYSHGEVKADDTRRYLEEFRVLLFDNYEGWYFGHHHDNHRITAKDTLLYEKIIQIA